MDEAGVDLSDFVMLDIPTRYELMLDCLVKGHFNNKGYIERDMDKGIRVHWFKHVWQTHIPSKIMIFVWKLLHNRLPIK